MPRRANHTGTAAWAGRLKWVAHTPARLGATARTGFETRADAERMLDEAIATGIVPPARVRRRRVLAAMPVVALGAADFAWARRAISRVARKHEHLRDDIEAEAMLALHLASLDFRPGGNHFRSYASMKIRGAVTDFLRTQNRSVSNARHCKEPERHQSAHFVVLDDAQWERLPAHDGEAPEELIDARRRQVRLERMIAGLPERHAAMLRMHVVDEVALKEIGTAFGVTESRVCQIVNGALQRLAGKKVLLRRVAA